MDLFPSNLLDSLILRSPGIKSKAGSEILDIFNLLSRPVLSPLIDIVNLSWIGITII